MNHFKLVIFDCDGVLVDSEKITQQALMGLLNTECQLSLTLEDMYQKFLGRSIDELVETIEFMTGKENLCDLKEKCNDVINRTLSDKVMPVKVIHQAIRGISIPYCIASSGTYEKMQITLEKTDLLPLFVENIYSTSEVERGKPYPDVYLHAAHSMGVFDPAKCVVVEDSPLGVKGGCATGMTVLGYSGDTDAQKLIDAGAHLTFDNMSELPLKISTMDLFFT